MNVIQKASLKDLRVLVVEDTPDLLRIYARVLERCGATVTTATCLSEALDRYESNKPQILLSDIAMPGGDGYALIRHVRASEAPGTHMPAAALSAFTGSEHRAQALTEGFDTFVPKPIMPFELAGVASDLACRLETPANIAIRSL